MEERPVSLMTLIILALILLIISTRFTGFVANNAAAGKQQQLSIFELAQGKDIRLSVGDFALTEADEGNYTLILLDSNGVQARFELDTPNLPHYIVLLPGASQTVLLNESRGIGLNMTFLQAEPTDILVHVQLVLPQWMKAEQNQLTSLQGVEAGSGNLGSQDNSSIFNMSNPDNSVQNQSFIDKYRNKLLLAFLGLFVLLGIIVAIALHFRQKRYSAQQERFFAPEPGRPRNF